MKKKLIALVLMLALVLTFGLVACGKTETEATFKAGKYTAYGAVHNVYLGVAEITVDANGAITAASFDEYFLPHTYVAQSDATANAFQIDGRVFVKQADETFVWNDINGSSGAARATKANAYKQVSGDYLPGLTSNCADLAKAMLTNETVAKWFIAALGDGTGMKMGTYASDAFTAGTKTAKDCSYGVKKTDGKYWGEGHATGLGWKANIELIVSAFKNYHTAGARLAYDIKSATPNGEFVLSVGGMEISTGATANDFPQYWAVCVKAYAKALSASGLVF